MPINDFVCKSCGHRFEELHKMTDPAPPCEECGSETAKAIPERPPTAQFKGPGWFKTGGY